MLARVDHIETIDSKRRSSIRLFLQVQGGKRTTGIRFEKTQLNVLHAEDHRGNRKSYRTLYLYAVVDQELSSKKNISWRTQREIVLSFYALCKAHRMG